MNQLDKFHVVTIGFDYCLIDGLWNRIAAKSGDRFSHIVDPGYTPQDWPDQSSRSNLYFFRDDMRQKMPAPDAELLASLEREGVPTIHNMIMSDRIVSKLDYSDALSYTTFLARRLIDLLGKIKPTMVIGAFDGIHGSVGLAVARHMDIPWFAPNFIVYPTGLACFCDQMSPGARVTLVTRLSSELHSLAEASLRQLENRNSRAPSYIAPLPLSFAGKIASVPRRLLALHRTIRKSHVRDFIKFTEARTAYSVSAVLKHYVRTARARKALSMIRTHIKPPATPYVFFGLHMQPESSIDVWAPFFSNQLWVVELLSRSIPPTHKLLVKIHRSDMTNFTREQLGKMEAFPGVEFVHPFADSLDFIEKADLCVSIQGSIGLEAALLGKPVIMLGDSPVVVFPSASRIGAITDLPGLIRRKLAETPPTRSEIVKAFALHLAPFMPASYNDWTVRRTNEEIEDYVRLVNALKQHVAALETSPPTQASEILRTY